MSNLDGKEAMSDEEDVDPRIQVELDNLNGASEVINHLEAQLDDLTARFRSLVQNASIELKQMKKKLGRCVDKARPYFECKKSARKAQVETQKAARQFQRANGLYEAAKETVTLAEERFLAVSGERRFDAAWQEMLNHATAKVFESEQDKSRAEAVHQKEASELASLELKVTIYQRKYGNSITKARPYFDLKSEHESILEEIKQQVQNLQVSIQAAKENYKLSLQKLEAISEEIHAKRQQKSKVEIPSLPQREPGVGADSDGSCSSLEINLESEVGSLQSFTPDVSDHENDDEEDVTSAAQTRAINKATSSHVRAGVLMDIPALYRHQTPVHFPQVPGMPNLAPHCSDTFPTGYPATDLDPGVDLVNMPAIKNAPQKVAYALQDRASQEAADGISLPEEFLSDELEGIDLNDDASRSRSNTLIQDEPATLEITT